MVGLSVVVGWVAFALPADAAKGKPGGTQGDSDLVVSSAAHWGPIAVGDEATFAIDAGNAGPSTATSVRLTATISGPAAIVAITTWRATCSGTSPVVCSAEDLPADQHVGHAGLTIRVRATGLGTITARGDAVGAQRDPNASNNTASSTIDVVPDADLSVMSSRTSRDEVAMVSHRISNDGPADATNVRVEVTATGLATVASTSFACSPTQVTGRWSCFLLTLADRQSATIYVMMNEASYSLYDDLVVTSRSGYTRATATADQPDPTPYNTGEAEVWPTYTRVPTCRVTCGIPRP